MRIGFSGCGNMGEAMLSGALKSGFAKYQDIYVYTNTPERMESLKDKYNINCSESNKTMAESSDVIVLAIKPNKYEAVIKDIKDSVKTGAIVISVTPAYKISTLEQLFNRTDVKIVRTMPNTPALVGQGITGISFSKNIDESDKQIVMDFMGSFGKTVLVEEELMGAIGSLSGSSPAFVYMFIEAMGQAGIELGIPAKTSYYIASQSVLGSAHLAMESESHLSQLRDNVCSAGGTTIKGVNELESSGFKGNVISAMKKSYERFKELEH